MSAPHRPTESADGIPAARERHQPTIIVVEDEPIIRRTMRLVLEGAGYRQVEANSLAEVSRLLTEQGEHADLLILDVSLANQGDVPFGPEFQRAFPNLPVLFVSGHSRDDASRMLELPLAANFLHKPFTLIELFELVEALLR
jgi:DNA-binding response OmpR family regulator